jgi:FlaA1/EpsC-like NDP-sugar epimerase
MTMVILKLKLLDLRKGEKLYEELLVDKESVQTEIKSIYQSIENKISILEFKNLHNKLIECYKLNDLQKLLSSLNNNFIKYDIRNSK